MKPGNQSTKINVIIPVAPNENITKNFIDTLKKLRLPESTEVIFVSVLESLSASASASTPTSTDDVKMDLPLCDISDLHFKFIKAESGRANCMNAGAKVVQDENTYLFFIHADTIFEENSFQMLENTVKKHPASLMYFDLVFYDGHPLMKLNEIGVLFRTRFLKTPFGDQCFCIRKDIFESLGGYPIDVRYGEDHMFVRKARRNNVKIIPVKAKVKTSARKYINNGWLKTTMLHLFLWRKQIHYDRRIASGGDIR
jgi:hypothetical protein